MSNGSTFTVSPARRAMRDKDASASMTEPRTVRNTPRSKIAAVQFEFLKRGEVEIVEPGGHEGQSPEP